MKREEVMDRSIFHPEFVLKNSDFAGGSAGLSLLHLTPCLVKPASRLDDANG